MSFFLPEPSMMVVFSLSMRHALGAAEHVERDVLELDAEVLADHLAVGQHGDVLQHGLAAVAEARRLHGRDLQAAAQLVDDQRRQRLALDLFGDDEQRLAGLHHGFEHRQQRLQAGELLLVDEDVGLLQLGDHLVGVGDEVGREIAAVELHALDDVELALEALGLLDRDDALVADLLHGLGDHVADRLLAVGRDGADLGDLAGVLDLLGPASRSPRPPGRRPCRCRACRSIGFMPAATAFRPSRTIAWASTHGGGGAVTGDVVGLLGDLAHHLRAHVLELVLELDLLGDGDAVLGRARRAERLLDDDVAALGAERDLHGVGEDVDAAQHALAGIGGKVDVFGSHVSNS